MGLLDSRTPEQKQAFKLAQIAGYYREMAISKGGTGHLRKELSDKEAARRKKHRQQVKQSRKANWR